MPVLEPRGGAGADPDQELDGEEGEDDEAAHLQRGQRVAARE